MPLHTRLEPGIFNALKFVLEYLWVDHFMHWVRGKLKRASNLRDLIEGRPVPIHNIIDRDAPEAAHAIWKRMFKCSRAKEDVRGTSEIMVNESGEPIRAGSCEPERQLSSRIMKESCRFFLHLLPMLTLLGLLLLEYATDTAPHCKNHPVLLNNAGTNIGILVSSFSCGRIRPRSAKEIATQKYSTYHVGFTDAYQLGNRIVCGCSDWELDDCVSAYNGSALNPPSEAFWRSSVWQNKFDTLEILYKIRRMVAMPKLINWKPVHLEKLSPFKLREDAWVECFESPILSAMSRVVACSFKQRISNKYADIIFIIQTREPQGSFSLIYYSLPLEKGASVKPLLKGIVDGPNHIFRGVPVIYHAVSTHLSKINLNHLVAAGLELVVHFDISATASTEGYVLSHAIVLMLSVYTRLRPAGKGMWRTCKGNIMTISKSGAYAFLGASLFTVLSIMLAVITSPEHPLQFLTRGRALESSRWAVNSMISEKLGGTSCLTGVDIDAEVILTRNDKVLHLSVVDAGEKSTTCNAKDLPLVQGRFENSSKSHVKQD